MNDEFTIYAVLGAMAALCVMVSLIFMAVKLSREGTPKHRKRRHRSERRGHFDITEITKDAD